MGYYTAAHEQQLLKSIDKKAKGLGFISAGYVLLAVAFTASTDCTVATFAAGLVLAGGAGAAAYRFYVQQKCAVVCIVPPASAPFIVIARRLIDACRRLLSTGKA